MGFVYFNEVKFTAVDYKRQWNGSPGRSPPGVGVGEILPVFLAGVPWGPGPAQVKGPQTFEGLSREARSRL